MKRTYVEWQANNSCALRSLS